MVVPPFPGGHGTPPRFTSLSGTPHRSGTHLPRAGPSCAGPPWSSPSTRFHLRPALLAVHPGGELGRLRVGERQVCDRQFHLAPRQRRDLLRCGTLPGCPVDRIRRAHGLVSAAAQVRPLHPPAGHLQASICRSACCSAYMTANWESVARCVSVRPARLSPAAMPSRTRCVAAPTVGLPGGPTSSSVSCSGVVASSGSSGPGRVNPAPAHPPL